MRTEQPIAAQVESASQADARIGSSPRPLSADDRGGTLTLQGEVADVASKRRAVARACAIPGVTRVVDCIRVPAAVAMSDGEVRDRVRERLVSEPAFHGCSLSTMRGRAETIVRDLGDAARGAIRVRVERREVTLEGRVPSRVHQRLAEVLAWRVPGTELVDNALAIVPFEEDGDEALREAVRAALESGPFAEGASIAIEVRGRAVTLRGQLPTEERRRAAVRDAWLVPGVAEVHDALRVMH